MAETKQVVFSHQEIATILVKEQGIHEGFWGIYFELGLAGGAVPAPPPTVASGAMVVPAAMVLIKNVGIIRFDQPNAMTVDASKVNPAS